MTEPVIFKKETVSKATWYKRLIEIMIEGGWQNISSKPSVDSDVMYSTGEHGDIPMYIQLSDNLGDSTSGMGTSTERVLNTRLVGSYTPGTPGNPGTFQRSVGIEPWRYALILIGRQDPNTLFDIYYHCNKNRVIIINEFPPGEEFYNTGPSYGTIVNIGISDRNIGENKLSAPIIAITQLYSVTGVRASGHPAMVTFSSTLNVLIDLPPSNPNPANVMFMSEIAYGGGTDIDSIRGYIDGIFAIKDGPTVPLETGDEVIDQNDVKYRIIKINPPLSGYGGAFTQTTLYAYRVE
jgi:hypothetical protein